MAKLVAKVWVRLALGGFVLAAAVLAAAFVVWYRSPPQARHAHYALKLERRSERGAQGLKVGFARVDVTPELGERPVWLGGFSTGRAATEVHDPVWARAFVFENGGVRVGIVALDLVGHYYTDTIEIRRAVEDLGFSYVAVCSTHNHEGPDAVGLWGRYPGLSGRDEHYMESVRRGAERALRDAVSTMQPAVLDVAHAPSGTERRMERTEKGLEALELGWIRDDRPPFVIDPRVTALRFRERRAGFGRQAQVLGTVVIWGNHPESLGSENTALSSDYPHYVRTHMEARTGAPSVFLVGAVGGIMSPLGVEVSLADGTRTRAPGFPKAEAIGRGVAEVALSALESPQAKTVADPAIRVAAKTLYWPLANAKFYLGAKLGVLERGFTDGKIRSEVGVLRIGPLELLLVPGEIYPELVLGGVEHPEGADFADARPEAPPLYALSSAPYQAVIGLANDLIGYIIPRSEWDEEPPYLYGSDEAYYGETNSTGPEAAGAIHAALGALLEGAGPAARRLEGRDDVRSKGSEGRRE